MKTTCSLACFFLFFQTALAAQTKLIDLSPSLVIGHDTVEFKSLHRALSSFLEAAEKPNEENALVLESEKVETFILLDEIEGAEKNKALKDDHFFKAQLINAARLEPGKYLIQVAYLGQDAKSASMRACFTLVAHKTETGFLFSSPLSRNTQTWKVLKEGDVTFHYEARVNRKKTKQYSDYVTKFDKKLKSSGKHTQVYCTNDIVSMLRLIGVDYKSDYNGRKESVFGSSHKNQKLLVFGNHNGSFEEFDPHDLWHERLALVVPRSSVNKPVDEGCAYLYGGSWGYTWKQIFNEFLAQVAKDPNCNWAEMKESPVYVMTGTYKNSVDYLVNALLVQKIEKEKGFPGVWEFLNCGKFEKGNARYYQALEKLTGITKESYNASVWELVKAHRPN